MRLSATLVLYALTCASAYSAMLVAPSQSGNPGQTATAPFSFSSEGAAISGVQFDLEWDQALDVKVVLGGQARQSSKILYTAAFAPRVLRCLVIGMNREILQDGELLKVFLIIGPNATPGLAQVRVNNASATGPSGDAMPLGSLPINVQVQQSAGVTVPIVSSEGLLNAASLLPGPIAPGEIITLIGSFPVDEVALLFNGIQAPILYNGLNQVNAIVPFALDPAAPSKIQARIGGRPLDEVSLTAGSVAPAIFTQNGGSGAGAILNEDYTLNSAANPASRGSVIMVYGTGFGAMDPLPADGQISNDLATTRLPVTASISGVPAKVLYAGTAPGQIAGLVQINVKVPEETAPSLTAPVFLEVGGVSTPPGVTVSIQ